MSSHFSLRIPFATAAVLFFAMAAVTAQEPGQEAVEEEKSRLARCLKHMQKCDARLASDAEKQVEMLDRPVLLFGDSARANQNGSVWVFGKKGRPLAFIELYKGTARTDGWVHAATLTGKDLIVMKTPLSGQWKPTKPQIEPVVIADAPSPEAKVTQRLRQARELARRFTAHEFWDPDNSRSELRLLAQPVHRYSDAKQELQDGAAFVIAHGTNPEVVLLIEALGKDLKTARWHYSLARLGSAEIYVELDGKDVWKCPRATGVVGSPSDPYWLFFAVSGDGE
ncbi:MAG: hypothetical protein IAF94_24700 [Pirellulaceae bacterium]|nr:hypothetical protein [Pirellulaceae bacterium]